MSGLLDDLRLAARRLIHQPGFSCVAVLTLALGLGANTAIFTLVHAVMLQPLPVTAPSELYRLGDTGNCCINSGLQDDYSLFSYELYAHLRDHTPEFSSLAAFQANLTPVPVRPEGEAVASPLPAQFVSGNYFGMFGVGASAGRVLTASDDKPGAPPVAVISHRAWSDVFARDPSVIGKTLNVDGTAMTLVGVAAESFFGDTVRPDPVGVWMPLALEPVMRGTSSLVARPDQDWLYIIGRMLPGQSRASVESHVSNELRQWLGSQTFLTAEARPELSHQHITVVAAAAGVETLRINFGQSLFVLFGMSGLVLLIASANLANLLLSRANRGEAALRSALGASVARLVRQSLTEGIVLALAGGVAALLVASIATRTIVALVFPNAAFVPIDQSPSLPVLGFSLLLAVVTGALFTAAPAWATSRTDPIDALRGTGRGGGERSFVPRRALVIAQVSLSMVLLTGAGLLGRSLMQLERQPLGFDPAGLQVAFIAPPAALRSVDALSSLYDRLMDRVATIPGVQSVSYSMYSPMEGNNWSSEIGIEGRKSDPNRPDVASWNRVGPRYFETTGTRIVQGRPIRDTDTATSERVVVVSQAFVREYMPDTNPIGRRLGIMDPTRQSDYTIVGVSDDVKYAAPSRPARPMILIPGMQTVAYGDAANLNVQTRSIQQIRAIELRMAPGGTSSVEPLLRRALAEIDPGLNVLRVRSMAQQISFSFRMNRLMSALTAAYGLLALALASLGLYGVTAYGVSRRRREIGVRLALGAEPRRVVLGVLRGAAIQTTIGLAIGIPIALVSGNAVATLLYGVQPRDPFILSLAALVLLLSAVLAAVVPARRAAAVNPTEALRAD